MKAESIPRYVLSCAMIAGFIAIPFVISNPYYLGIIIVIIINALLAVSIWIILQTGQVSLCHVGFSAIGGYTAAALVMSFDFSFWMGTAVGIIAAGFASLLIGLITLRLKSHYFFIVTASFGEIIRIVFSMIDYPFGGLVGILNLPPPDPIAIPGLPAIVFSSSSSFYYLTLAVAILIITIIYRLSNSHIGHVFRAIAQNDLRAEHLGINIMGYKVMAFVIGSMFASLTGIIYCFNAGCMLPTTFGFWQGIYCLIFVSVGGGAHIAGPIIGAVFFSLLSQLLKPVQMFEPVIYGLALIFVMMFFREGLLGGILGIWCFLKGKLFIRQLDASNGIT